MCQIEFTETGTFLFQNQFSWQDMTLRKDVPEGKEPFPGEGESHCSALEEIVTAQWGLTLVSGFQRWGEDGGKDTGPQIEEHQPQSRDFIASKKIPWRL